jgi:hypothetical protein
MWLALMNEDQASAGVRSAPSSLLHLWKAAGGPPYRLPCGRAVRARLLLFVQRFLTLHDEIERLAAAPA